MSPMVTKNHTKSLSQPERAFWREAFLHYIPIRGLALVDEIKDRARFADASVEEYRKRITWRSEP